MNYRINKINNNDTGVDFVKKYWGTNENIGEGKLSITNEIIGVFQLLGGTCPGCPQSLRL